MPSCSSAGHSTQGLLQSIDNIFHFSKNEYKTIQISKLNTYIYAVYYIIIYSVFFYILYIDQKVKTVSVNTKEEEKELRRAKRLERLQKRAVIIQI